jgi:hypothetical protein
MYRYIHKVCINESGDFATMFFLVQQHWGRSRYQHFTANFNPLPALMYQNVLDLNVACRAKRTQTYWHVRKFKCPLKKMQSSCPCSRDLNWTGKGLKHFSCNGAMDRSTKCFCCESALQKLVTVLWSFSVNFEESSGFIAIMLFHQPKPSGLGFETLRLLVLH